MPTYEYECLENGHRFEEFQFITEEPIETCPYCGGKVRRLIGSGAGILFKGSGFYQTDYRSESYRQAQKAEKTASESGRSTDATSSKKAASAGTGPAKDATRSTGSSR